MELIDDKIPSPNLFFTPTEIVDSPSYTLEDNIEWKQLHFDNTYNLPRCLIHGIPMVWEFDLKSPCKCPICEK